MNTHENTDFTASHTHDIATNIRRALPFVFVGIGFVAAYAGIALGGWGLLLPALVLYVLVPVSDALVGISVDNPQPQAPVASFAADAVLWACVPLQLGLIAFGLSRITGGALTGLEQFAVAVNLGLITGATGITVAHELMHRKNAASRALAELLMATATYTWFCVEHVYGHHRNVATPNDPATSRLGESLYAFWPRTLIGTMRSAISIERRRLAKRKLPWWSLDNRLVRYPLGIALLYALIFSVFGGLGVAAFALQSVVAVLLLETINYLEHYGLQRKQSADGRYEKVRPQHSWNSSHRLSNWMLVNLARHSDHHAYAARPYHALRHYDDVPTLPTGYAGMFLLALVPPVWFAVMDRRVVDWNGRAIATDAR